jgi:hypothetical protein
MSGVNSSRTRIAAVAGLAVAALATLGAVFWIASVA